MASTRTVEPSRVERDAEVGAAGPGSPASPSDSSAPLLNDAELAGPEDADGILAALERGSIPRLGLRGWGICAASCLVVVCAPFALVSLVQAGSCSEGEPRGPLELCMPLSRGLLFLPPPTSTTTMTSTATSATTVTQVTTETSVTTLTKVTKVTKTTVTSTTTTEKLAPDSLFCFALVQPQGYEIGMIEWLHKEKKSLFLCERHAIYSNQSLSIKGLDNKLVKTSLDAPIGGQWNTALNTPIFQKLWMQVIEDGMFKEAGWTVKLDVDAVFLPSRLHQLIAGDDYQDPQGGNGHFLNNCQVKGSLHGPIEVLSQRALEVYGERNDECDQSWQQEDVFMRMCLVSLDVTEHFDWVVMSEQYCNDDWDSCKTSHVTFHPYKDIESYSTCLEDAENNGYFSV